MGGIDDHCGNDRSRVGLVSLSTLFRWIGVLIFFITVLKYGI